jgi:hypothetical protein
MVMKLDGKTAWSPAPPTAWDLWSRRDWLPQAHEY